MRKYQITFFYSDGFFKKIIVEAGSVFHAECLAKKYHSELLLGSERMETETYELNNNLEQTNEELNTGELG